MYHENMPLSLAYTLQSSWSRMSLGSSVSGQGKYILVSRDAARDPGAQGLCGGGAQWCPGASLFLAVLLYISQIREVQSQV